MGEPAPSVWARAARPRRERPTLSQELIVSEAVRLLDAEGTDALSMRRLSTRLGASAAALYSYMESKDDLIEMVVDEVYGEIDASDVHDPAGWRSAATRRAYSLRRAILRHPWIVSVLGDVGLAYLGPNMMRVSDGTLALFEAAGFAADDASYAMKTVAAYVIGVAVSEAAWLNTIARSDQTERDWVERLWPSAEKAARAYPRLRERYASQRSRDPEETREKAFAQGLEVIFDGLQARLGRPPG
jgi:AcrR family transcriptional regulator